MSGRGENATSANVNRNAKNSTASTTGTTSVAIAGGSAINFPNQNRPSPGPEFFAKATAERRADARYVEAPR